MKTAGRIFREIYFFYADGFRGMTIGKRLWVVILIKLFILFFVLRLFFFRDFLGSRFHTEDQKSEYVLDQLTRDR